MSTNPWQANVEQVRGEWGWFLVLGVALLVLGLAAITAPLITTLTVVIILGMLALIGGAAQVAHAFWARRWSGFLLQLLIGILDFVIGVIMVAQPERAALVLTILIAAWLIAGGLFRSVAAMSIRFPNWGWTVGGGLISLLLGVLILSEWPLSADWFIGLCVGISLLFQGWSWIMLALALRSLPAPPTPP